MPRLKPPTFPPCPSSWFQEFLDYGSGKRHVRSPYTILALCRFGRWISWALCPKLRFFPSLTDMVDGHLSMEMKAKLSLQKPKHSPLMLTLMAATPMVAALMPLRVRGKAS